MRPVIRALAMASMSLVWAAASTAQPLGTFTWQLQPFCNRVTVTVIQNGAIYTLDGYDDQCNAAQRAPVVGLATPNPDGTIGLGFNVVTVPGGTPVAIDARIPYPILTGTWSDSAGNSGTFAFAANAGGSPRPTPGGSGGGDITEVTAGAGLNGGGTSGAVTLSVDPAEVQSRVTTACPAGQALRSINQDGTAACQAATGTGGGDITGVLPGLGLTGGGDTGEVTLHVAFGTDGAGSLAARSDHTHGFGNSGSNTRIGVGALADLLAGGTFNVAAGNDAAANLTTGGSNVAMGAFALSSNLTGSNNIAIGRSALGAATGGGSVAIGTFSLDSAQNGAGNTAIGDLSLSNLTTGSSNVAVGNQVGLNLVTGSRSTVVGDNAEVGTGAQTNATAIGANALVAQNDSLVLGSINGVNGATADTRVGIGTTTPQAPLEVASNNPSVDEVVVRVSGVGPELTPSFGLRRSRGTAVSPTAVQDDDLLGIVGGQGHDGTAFRFGAAVRFEATENWTASARGSRVAFITNTNGTSVSDVRMVIDHNGNIGVGNTIPAARLHVSGGTVRIDTLGAAGATTLCRNATNLEIATCSSSLRYKRDVAPFRPGLALVDRLRPISFTWKDGGMADVGFGAEDVAAIDPRLAVFNADGTVEGVKYDRLTTVLVNAVKELEARNQALERRLAALEQAGAASRTP